MTTNKKFKGINCRELFDKQSNVAVIDLDGCLSNEDSATLNLGKPNKKVVGYIKTLQAQGLFILIHTTRLGRLWSLISGIPCYAQALAVISWLKKYKIPFDDIYFNEKPYGKIYLDNKAVSSGKLK
jgi:hypothetical protein